MAKSKTYTTPAGMARWCCVTKPSTKFNPDGIYSVDLALPAAEAAPLIEALTKMAEEAKVEAVKKKPAVKTYAVKVPFLDELDKEGNLTGNFVFKFKQKAIVRPKGKEAFDTHVGRFDAKGKELASAINIGSGSKLKVAYEVWPFTMDSSRSVGVTLRLKAVQVLDLVEFKGGTADSYGFGEEDGYTAEEAEQPEGEQPATAGAAAGNGDF